MNKPVTGRSSSPACQAIQTGYALYREEGDLAGVSDALREMTAPWKSSDAWWAEVNSRMAPLALTQCPVCDRGQRLGIREVVLPLASGDRFFLIEFSGHAHNLKALSSGEMVLVRDVTADRCRDEAIHLQLSQYESICDFIEEVYYRIDLEGRILFISPSSEKLLLYPPGELLGRSFGDLCVSPTHFSELLKILEKTEKIHDFDLVMHCKRGRQIPVSVTMQVVRDEAGNRTAVEGIMQDITEREQLDAMLMEGTRRFQDAMARLEQLKAAWDQHAMVYVTDPEGNIKSVNGMVVSVGQYAESELIGKNPRIFDSDYHPKSFFKEMWRTINGGQTWQGEVRNRKKNGDFFWVDCTIVPFLTPLGRPFQFVFIATNISNRVRTGMRMERNRDFLHRVMDAMGEGVYVLDLRGSLLSLNREGEQLLGWRDAELMHRNLHDAIHFKRPNGTAFPAADCTVHQSLLGRAFRVEDDHFVRKDGTFLPVSHVTAPLREGQEIIGSVAVFRDNSQHWKHRRELEETRDAAMSSSHRKSEFLANMSHEIRTPMNAIVGMNNLLMDTLLNDEQMEFAEIVRDSSQSLLSLINDILDFSKIEAGKIDIEEIDFNPVTVVEGAAELLSTQAHEKGISLSTFITPRLPPVLRGDPGRLRQMLLNLINNAIKFTDEGEVVVRALIEAETVEWLTVRFAITDTGIGLPEKVGDSLFEPFVQADEDTIRKYGGTGLGLAICKHLAELMGGKIGVETADGEGTLFWFRIPFRRSDSGTREEEEGLNIAPLRGLRVLTLMESTSDLEILEHYFCSWGMTYQGIVGGEEGVAVMRQAVKDGVPFSLAIISASLSDQDLLAFSGELGREGLLQTTWLVALLDWEDRERKETLMGEGYAACLTKPVRQTDWIECLVGLIDPASVAPRVESVAGQLAKGVRPAELDAYDALESGQLLLLVEDNLVNQKVTMLQLEKLGYAAHAVANGREAVEAVSHLPYALILMDCQMPVMDGFEATHSIRKMDRASSRHIPIIAMTANAMKGDRERCIQAGMDDYMSKPVAPENLKQKLEYWIPKGTGELPPIEIHQLRQLCGDDEEMIRELLLHFPFSVRELLDRLWKNVHDRNAGLVEEISSELKEASSNMGASGMAKLARAVECAANHANWEEVQANMERLEGVFQRVEVYAREY